MQLEISDQSMGQIKKLMDDTGTKTIEEFFNNALTVFDWAVKEVQAGHRIRSAPAADSAAENGLVRRENFLAVPIFAPLKKNTPAG
jgi:hypothetical protein